MCGRKHCLLRVKNLLLDVCAGRVCGQCGLQRGKVRLQCCHGCIQNCLRGCSGFRGCSGILFVHHFHAFGHIASQCRSCSVVIVE